MATSLLRRVLNIDPEEVGPALAAMGYFFCLLCGYFLIRPVREAFGVEGGVWGLHWLFVATAAVMLLVNPIYGAVVSRWPRRLFVPAVYRFFILNLLGFYVLRVVWPEAIGAATGRVFYVWVSVFNLFAVSIFWQIMADSFTLEQARRLFAFVAAGGTVGALAGAALSGALAERIGAVNLMLVSALVLEGGVVMAVRLMRSPGRDAARTPTCARCGHELTEPDAQACPACGADLAIRVTDRPLSSGGSTWRESVHGLTHVARNPYLLGIAAYIVAMAIVSTFLYFAQASIIAGLSPDTDERTAMFASIDFWTQATTLTLQVLVVGRLMRRLGVGVMLAVLPVLGMVLLGSLALWPTLLALTIAQVGFRAGKYAVARPARETLFTVLPREDKYKAKAVADTFVYRTGDVMGAVADAAIRAAGLGLLGVALAAAPLALVWAGLGVVLGARQRALAGQGR